MPKYYDTFDHFARDLFLHVTPFKMSSSDKDKLDPIILMDDASYVLNLFADGHCELFRRIFVMTEDEVLQTDKQFFMLALPRCLNLIDSDRYYFSIMLVAGFLQELVTYLGETRVCYRFHFTAYKCLVAVFKRAFINSFESNGGWNGLEKYLIRVIETLHSTKENLIMSALNDGDNFLTKRVVNLIRNCDDISDDFSLNEYENSLLMDDDIKDLEESLNYNKVDYDPVLTWPLKEKEVHKKINYMKEMTLTDSQTSDDSNEERDMDDYSPTDDFNAEKDMAGSSHHPSYPNTGKDVGGSSPPHSGPNTGEDMQGSSPPSDPNIGKDMEGSSPPLSDSNTGKDMEGSSSLPSDSNIGKDMEGSSPPPSDSNIGKGMEGSTPPLSDSNIGKDMEGSSPPLSDSNIGKDMEGSSPPLSDPNSGKDMEGSTPPLSDSNTGKDMEGSSSLPSDLYTEKDMKDSEKTDKFLKKMKKRTCPCCRLKCYQFSYKLFTKQINSALNKKNGILRTP